MNRSICSENECTIQVSKCRECQSSLFRCVLHAQHKYGNEPYCRGCFRKNSCERCGVWSSREVIFIDVSPMSLARAVNYPHPVVALGKTLYLCRGCMGGASPLDLQKQYGYAHFGTPTTWNKSR